MTQAKKRVSVVITEYWDISHADVFITKMLEGFTINGIHYTSSLEIVSMYVDRFPDTDISRSIAAKHGVPMYDTIEQALLCGKDKLNIDGIIIIGEHGEYPRNKYDQILYPRREFFETCLQVMLAHDKMVPLFTDKGFAITTEDILWVYEQVEKHNFPFMSSSSIPFGFQQPALPIPMGAPMHKMFGFSFGRDVERYVYHVHEMLQSVAENRAYGETGIESVVAYEGEEALQHLMGPDWEYIYRTIAGYINVSDIDHFPYTIERPVFMELHYADGLRAGILHVDREIKHFYACFQLTAESLPFCTEFYTQPQKPYTHAGIFILELERFIHSGRCSFPKERSLLTTGATDAIMKSLYYKKKMETPHLMVKY